MAVSIHPADDSLPIEAPPAALLLTVPQAAALLQISESLCYEMVAKGELPVKRLGPRGIRLPRRALEAWAVAGLMPGDEST